MYYRSCSAGILFAATLMLAFSSRAFADSFIWIEGENPSTINVKPLIAGWGHSEYLSGGKWLQISIDADKTAADAPAGGAMLSYQFTAPAAATYQIWNRIGYEFVRSPFRYRVDNGPWVAISPDMLTTDQMELQAWNEVAWLDMGSAKLSAGQHTLFINIPRMLNSSSKPQRMLYASDCLCISSAPFYPNGKYPPGSEIETNTDRQAAQQVFALPAPVQPGSRSETALRGLWQICRDDEQLPAHVAVPIAHLPAHPYWSAIPVPGDKNTLRPDLLLAHRIWYRTRINVPAACSGHSFALLFPQNSLNTTVFVNGIYCGFNPNPFARFAIDVSRAVHPGINTLEVGIRDAWYGFENNPQQPMKLRRMFNLPVSYFHQGFQDLAYPIWNAPQSGILACPRFLCMGSAYASNVFIQPSTAQKTLTAKVKIRNPGKTPFRGSLQCEAIDPATGKTACTLPVLQCSVAPGASQTLLVTGPWLHPVLWWPNSPHLYVLRTIVSRHGKPQDIRNTTFGFREWSIQGIHFLLNGVPFHGWEDTTSPSTPQKWLAFYRKSHQTMYRFWGTSFEGMTPNKALSFFDRSGVVVRRQGMLDGEAIGYMAIEPDPLLQKRFHSPINMELMHNWTRQMTAQVRGERNHPCIMIWSIENEFLYINCINLYGSLMHYFEAAETDCAHAVEKTDPTRPVMVDGGGACKNNSLPVFGNHYIDGPWTDYPPLAYLPNTTGGGRGRWVWDKMRPRFIGEDFYMTGIHPGLSAIGGEEAFQGKQGCLAPTGLMETILQQGYRWADYGAWDFYTNATDTNGQQYNSFRPRAVFCKQWNYTFGAGQAVKRRFGIFNDTHSASPILFRWTLRFPSRPLQQHSESFLVPPGESLKFTRTLTMPHAARRTSGTLLLQLLVHGKTVFTDTKPITILPAHVPEANASLLQHLTFSQIAVFDPEGAAAQFLHSRHIPFTLLHSLNALPMHARVLLIGSNSLSPAESGSSRFAAWAAAGRSVISLEQRHPLEYQAAPAMLKPVERNGWTAFPTGQQSPVLHGLHAPDFFTWGSSAPLYTQAWRKPPAGAETLLECGPMLHDTPLLQIPVDKGLMLLNSLRIEQSLASSAVAQRLLLNLIAGAVSWHSPSRPVLLTASASPFAKAVQATGVRAAAVSSPLQALQQAGRRIALIEANPQNLALLAAHPALVHSFTHAGGWIVFNGLTPQGLAAYNQITGFAHMIRPYRVERTLFTLPRNPLTAGMTAGDLAMYSSRRIFSWTAGNYVSSHEFRYVVDASTDVAPFAVFQNGFYYNLVNGFVSSDGWPFIVDVPVPKTGALHIQMQLPQPQQITALNWIGNTMYWPSTQIKLVFNNNQADALTFSTPPDNLPHQYTFPPRNAQEIDLQVTAWKPLPGVQPLIGADNFSLYAQRPPSFFQRVKPMVNCGGMVEYPRGKGGMVLFNIWFRNHETVPENAQKKQNLLAALLHNLHAGFHQNSALIAGGNLRYSPVSLAGKANQYRGRRGWFGSTYPSFSLLPAGDQTFAGVRYNIYRFATSPVPDCIMLGGAGTSDNLPQTVQGIAVNKKADALFFLQTARIDAKRTAEQIKNRIHLEMADYVVHYTDGSEAKVPVYADESVGNWLSASPTPLPLAQLAWTHLYARSGQYGAAWSMQWNNPWPQKTIAGIDLVYGPNRAGIPVLLAVTAAQRVIQNGRTNLQKGR